MTCDNRLSIRVKAFVDSRQRAIGRSKEALQQNKTDLVSSAEQSHRSDAYRINNASRTAINEMLPYLDAAGETAHTH